ncbi:unnamed protein product [Ascophyllum nodosum]
MKEESVAVYLASGGPFSSDIQSACIRCPLKMMVGFHVVPSALIVVTTVTFSRELERIEPTTFCPASANAFSVFVPCGVKPRTNLRSGKSAHPGSGRHSCFLGAVYFSYLETTAVYYSNLYSSL